MDSEQITPSKPAPSAINYAAFYKMSHASRLLLLPVVGGAVVFVVFLILAVGQTTSSHQTFTMDSNLPHGGLLMLAIGLVIVSVALYAWRQSKHQEAAFQQFLLDNQWSVITGPTTDDVATSMLGIGHDQKIEDAFSGTYHGMPFRAVRYEYTTGSGKSQTVHCFVDLRFDLKQAFPLIVLDNKQGEYFAFLNELPRIANTHELQLEGNFNDRYKVSVVPGTEQEVLQVLTPDFMAELMDAPLKVDTELEANKLYVIKHGPTHWDAPALQELFAMADVMIKNLGELADTWQASSSPAAVADIASTALQARQRVVLRPQHIIGIGGVIAVALYLLGMIMSYVLRSL